MERHEKFVIDVGNGNSMIFQILEATSNSITISFKTGKNDDLEKEDIEKRVK